MNWIRKIQAEGREPDYLVLEQLSEGTTRGFLGFIEQCYIKSLLEIGHRLTNRTPGGDGGPAFKGHNHTETTKELLRRSRTGSRHTQESRKAMSAVHLGLKETDDTKEKKRLAMLQHYEDPENHVAASLRIKASMTPEIVAAKSKRMIGNTLSAGRVVSDEERRATGVRSLGNTYGANVVYTEDLLRRRSEGLKRYNADPANQAAIAERRARQSATMKALHVKKKAVSI